MKNLFCPRFISLRNSIFSYSDFLWFKPLRTTKNTSSYFSTGFLAITFMFRKCPLFSTWWRRSQFPPVATISPKYSRNSKDFFMSLQLEDSSRRLRRRSTKIVVKRKRVLSTLQDSNDVMYKSSIFFSPQNENQADSSFPLINLLVQLVHQIFLADIPYDNQNNGTDAEQIKKEASFVFGHIDSDTSPSFEGFPKHDSSALCRYFRNRKLHDSKCKISNEIDFTEAWWWCWWFFFCKKSIKRYLSKWCSS